MEATQNVMLKNNKILTNPDGGDIHCLSTRTIFTFNHQRLLTYYNSAKLFTST